MTVLTARDIVRLNTSQFAAAQGTLERAFFDYPLMVYACPDARPRARGCVHFTRPSFTIRSAMARFTPVRASRGWPAGCRRASRSRRSSARSAPACWACRLPLAGSRSAACSSTANGTPSCITNSPRVRTGSWRQSASTRRPKAEASAVRFLEAITMRADEQRLPCYLETHGENSARLYERHGFETVRLFEVPGHAIPVWAMLRPARSA